MAYVSNKPNPEEDEAEDDDEDETDEEDEDEEDDEEKADKEREDSVDSYDVDMRRGRFSDGDRIEAGETVPLHVSFDNAGRDIKQGRMQVRLLGMDYGYARYNAGPFDVAEGESFGSKIMLEIPEDTEPGEYHARVTLTDGGYRMVKHTSFTVI